MVGFSDILIRNFYIWWGEKKWKNSFLAFWKKNHCLAKIHQENNTWIRLICNFYLLILRKNNSETYTTRRAWVQNCSELTMSSELWSKGLSLEENSSDPKNWYILMIFWNLLYGHPYVNSKDNSYLHHFQATDFSFPTLLIITYILTIISLLS